MNNCCHELQECISCKSQNSVVNNDAAHAVVKRLVPFFPATDAEVKSFTLFVKRSCAGPDGQVRSMSKWTGQGNASSIPFNLKKPLLFCNFIDNIHASIGELASSFVGAMQVFLDQNEDNPEANPCENNDERLGICKQGKT